MAVICHLGFVGRVFGSPTKSIMVVFMVVHVLHENSARPYRRPKIGISKGSDPLAFKSLASFGQKLVMTHKHAKN